MSIRIFAALMILAFSNVPEAVAYEASAAMSCIKNKSHIEHGYCQGFIHGAGVQAADFLDASASICIPEDQFRYGLFEELFQLYVQKNPGALAYSVPRVMREALREAFPCS